MIDLTKEAREVRNAYHREYRKRKLLQETPEERAERLRKNREYQRRHWERKARENPKKADMSQKTIKMQAVNVLTAQYVLGEAYKELKNDDMDKKEVIKLVCEARKALAYTEKGGK